MRSLPQTPKRAVLYARVSTEADRYFPYTFEEVAALVSPAVAAVLDPSVSYGIWWSTKHDIKVLGRTRTAEGDYFERVREAG